jgi:uncharacterized protein (TIGR02246 family)
MGWMRKMPQARERSVPSTADLDIEAWLSGHCAAWNANDVDGLFAGAAPDMHWINVVGMHWRGRDVALHAHRVFFKIMFRDVSLTLETIESIVGTGHCRVAVVRWALGDYTVPTGQRIVGERNRMTLVFTGEDDTLTLHHVANIRIDEQAAAHDPAAGLG